MSKITNRRDLDFLLYELLGIDELFETERYAAYDRDTIDEVLNSAQAIAEEVFLPIAAKVDANEPQFVDGRATSIPEVRQALSSFAEAGFFAAGFDEESGGLQMPYIVQTAMNGIFSAANNSVYCFAMLTTAAANMLNEFGSAEQRDQYLPPMLEGRWFGTMCLSEAHAGSSLADIRTNAEPRDDGAYNITGTKMWISGGEQEITENIVHMVLAKIPGGPPGVKGISLFVVPKVRVNDDGSLGDGNNIHLAGLNHKMGQRGLPNTVLNFGETGETIGYLVGEPHQGLNYMFHMMNEARILVGQGAAMLGLAGYLFSLDYAKTRLQGRHPNNKDPESPQIPIIEHADVKRMLLSQKANVEGALALIMYCCLLVDRFKVEPNADAKQKSYLLLEFLTPIAKSWPSEFCLEANKLAMQILGGYGYTREYPLERHYRDNRLNPIHEGAYAIHGIDLLGRKVSMQDGAAFELLLGEIQKVIDEATASEFADEAAVLSKAVESLRAATDAARGCPDAERRLANATLYLDAAGHIVIAWLWLWQALVAAKRSSGASTDDSYYEGKLTAMRFFYRYELPKVHVTLAIVSSLDTLTMQTDPDCL
jgi:alkylation response protein AidB-like acyl-CoA dehydrogenase